MCIICTISASFITRLTPKITRLIVLLYTSRYLVRNVETHNTTVLKTKINCQNDGDDNSDEKKIIRCFVNLKQITFLHYKNCFVVTRVHTRIAVIAVVFFFSLLLPGELEFIREKF